MKKFEDFNIIYVPSGDDKGEVFSVEDNREWLMRYKDKFNDNTFAGIGDFTDRWGEQAYQICFDLFNGEKYVQCEIKKESGRAYIFDHNRTDFLHSIPIGYIERGPEAVEFIEYIRSMIQETYDARKKEGN